MQTEFQLQISLGNSWCTVSTKETDIAVAVAKARGRN